MKDKIALKRKLFSLCEEYVNQQFIMLRSPQMKKQKAAPVISMKQVAQ